MAPVLVFVVVVVLVLVVVATAAEVVAMVDSDVVLAVWVMLGRLNVAVVVGIVFFLATFKFEMVEDVVFVFVEKVLVRGTVVVVVVELVLDGGVLEADGGSVDGGSMVIESLELSLGAISLMGAAASGWMLSFEGLLVLVLVLVVAVIVVARMPLLVAAGSMTVASDILR